MVIFRSFLKGLMPLIAGLALVQNSSSQQLPVYSQYMMNKFLINPAVAGSEGYTSFNITAREQWIGLANSPKTHAISAQTRVLKNSFISKGSSIRRKRKASSRSGRVGLGAYIFSDNTGLVSRTGMQLTYSYHIALQTGQLSFGLSGTFYQFKVNREQIIVYEQNDELINTFDNSMIIPDADFGVLYSDPRFFAGFSVSQLLESSFKFGKQGYDNFSLKRHYYLIAGYDLDISEYVMLEPSVMVKTTENWNFQVDLGTRIYFFENYWAGLSFRTGNALIAMGGIRIDKFYFGYAFDYNLSSIMKHTYGTHEFMLAMKLGDSARRYRWLIRY